MLQRLLLSFALCSLAASTVLAQPKEKKIIRQLKADIGYLASDALEGRRTATEGEHKAAAYIENRYKKLKIAPYKENYLHPFPFVHGKEMTAATAFTADGKILKTGDEAFAMPFSANSKQKIEGEVLPEVFEPRNIWMMSLFANKEEADDPHFDYEKTMLEKMKKAKKNGASAILFYDAYDAKYPPVFNKHSEVETQDLPIGYITFQGYKNYVKDNKEGIKISLNIEIKRTEYTGTNVAAYIDNKAPYTVVIGAHYDHLGYGEDGNSLYAGKDKEIHNGADDNASGTAALMQLAGWVKKKRLRNYNYLFINFSGEELGLYGSKAIVQQEKLDSTSIAYMINMDMVGRLNDSTKALTVGGVGTSPVWGDYVKKDNKQFKIVTDSSGVGPSDHTSFYYAGIPVLFFFTGTHHDYHKPTDDADKINYKGEADVMRYIYSIVEVMDTRPKPGFSATKQTTVGKTRFKVTLGIMPDYAYQEENGIRVDGVSSGRPAAIAGVKAGDIITALGANKVHGMQSYMEALSKFKEGDTTTVTVLRKGKTVKMKLTFIK